MPARDGTGPMGMGPMTGGGFGYCSGYASRIGGFGAGRGRGMGGGGLRQRRRIFRSPMPYSGGYPEDERQILEEEADMIQNRLQTIKKRLDILGSQKSQET